MQWIMVSLYLLLVRWKEFKSVSELRADLLSTNAVVKADSSQVSVAAVN